MNPTPSRARPVVLALGVVTFALLVGAGVVLLAALLSDPQPQPQPRLQPDADQALVAPRAEVRAAHLLDVWDRSRSAAWAAGDSAALDALYTVGSRAGRHDRVMLAAWTGRGLRVEGLRTQIVDIRVIAHRPGQFEVDVVDRVVDGTAVGAGVRRLLPRDAPTRRRVVLVEGPAGWVVDSVSAERSPARR